MNMRFNIMSLAAATDMNFGERAAYSLRMTVVGMLMIFAVLALLWAVLAVSKAVFYDAPKKRMQKSESSVKPAAAVAAPAAPAPAPTSPVAPTDDAAIVAAITAAIAAMRADEGCTSGFRVVSFRKADQSRAWNRK